MKPGMRVVHGRGSPEEDYRLRAADHDYLETFEGFLPTSIQYNYCEVFARQPDIDSTALMISCTCRFLNREDVSTGLMEQFLPRIRTAISSLGKKDLDDDSLLEQGPNEDWMDNMLRSGKVVYSQAAWAHALVSWSTVLNKAKKYSEADNIANKYREVIKRVEDDTSQSIIIKHDIGKNWSIYLEMLIDSALEDTFGKRPESFSTDSIVSIQCKI